MNCYSIAVSLAGSLLPAFRPMQDNRGRWTATQLLSPWLGLCYLLSDQCRIMGRWTATQLLSPWLGLCYLLSDLCRVIGRDELLLSCRLFVSVHQSSRWPSRRSFYLRLFGPNNRLSFGPKNKAGWTDFWMVRPLLRYVERILTAIKWNVYSYNTKSETQNITIRTKQK